MAYKALYREYRPKTFDDVIGQESIVKTIKNQIVSNKIPHAYLFCGTRGTGKTSTAKILSKAVNCLNLSDGEPCNECEMCKQANAGTLMDIIEIDAASNTGVDNIRSIIEDVKYPPHSAKYKIYIIDEVHMLSISAFNALLKTLEEPPSYVIFILATTDPQKVPATILSRCQRFDFKRIKVSDVCERLMFIAEQKHIDVEEKTLTAIAKISDGAMRDALSIFDQAMAMSDGVIKYDDVIEMLGLTSSEYVFKLINAMINKKVEEAMDIIDATVLNGKDIVQFVRDITRHFRNLLMVKISKKPEDILDLSEEAIKELREQARNIRSEEILRGINLMVEAENSAKTASQPRIVLELAVIKFCKRELDYSPEMVISRINTLEEKLKSGEFEISASVATKDAKVKTEEAPKKQAPKKPAAEKKAQGAPENGVVPVTMDEARAMWQEVIANIKNNMRVTVAVMLSLGDITSVSGNTITISFEEGNSFGKTSLEKPEHKKMVEEAFSKALSKKVQVEFIAPPKQNDIDKAIAKTKEILGEDMVEVIEQ